MWETTHRQTDIQTDRQEDRQTGRQTDRQTDRIGQPIAVGEILQVCLINVVHKKTLTIIIKFDDVPPTLMASSLCLGAAVDLRMRRAAIKTGYLLSYLRIKTPTFDWWKIGWHIQQSTSIWLWSRDRLCEGWYCDQTHVEVKLPINYPISRCVISEVTVLNQFCGMCRGKQISYNAAFCLYYYMWKSSNNYKNNSTADAVQVEANLQEQHSDHFH